MEKSNRDNRPANSEFQAIRCDRLDDLEAKAKRLDAVVTDIGECHTHFNDISHIFLTRAYIQNELKKLLKLAKGE